MSITQKDSKGKDISEFEVYEEDIDIDEYLGSKNIDTDSTEGKKTLIYIVILVLSVTAAFGLGRLSKINQNKTPVTIEYEEMFGSVSGQGEVAGEAVQGQYVGSKNGTKYHLPWCSGAQRINEENKVWFISKADAEAKGYGPAGNCKGI